MVHTSLTRNASQARQLLAEFLVYILVYIRDTMRQCIHRFTGLIKSSIDKKIVIRFSYTLARDSFSINKYNISGERAVVN